MEQQRVTTTADIIGATVHTMVRRGVPGAAVFVGLCYQLQRDNKFTVEEVTALATRFVLGEEVVSENKLSFQLEAQQASQRFAEVMRRYAAVRDAGESGFGLEK